MDKPSSLPKHARDHRANQLNPNNDAYWRSRGLFRPPQPDPSTSGSSSPPPSTRPSTSPSNRKSD